LKEQILVAVVAGIVLTALCWFAARVWRRVIDTINRRTVYRWLLRNTRDEPGESHVDTPMLAKGTCLSDERVRRACMSHPRVHRLARAGSAEQWSVWRAEPQSVYEKRGVIDV
jgi:hypothetical protein